jgi:hypothetical protein
LEPGLARQRARIERSRLGVLLRRHATLALAAAIVLEALAMLGVVPQLVVAVVPFLLLATTIAWALRRRLSLAAVAQLLDERLRLFDRLGTALELERRGAGNGAGSPLERRAVAEAAALVEGGAGQWRPRAVAAPREWAAAAAALLVLAALVVGANVSGSGGEAGGFAQSTALGGGEGPASGGKGAGNKRALEQYLGGPSTPRPSEHRQIAPGEQIRPAAGYRQPGKEAGNRKAELEITEEQANPTHVQYGFRFKDQAIGNKAYEAQPGGPKAGDPGSEGRAVSPGTKGAAQGGESKGGSAGANGGQGDGPGSSGGKKGAGQAQTKAPPGAPTGAAGAKAGARGAAPASKAAAGAKGQSAGAPGTSSSGAATAGNGAGGNRTGESLGFKGSESQGLKLQSGYAPFQAGKGKASSGKAGERQGGGGKSRSAQVEGSANFGGGGDFAFVPATGGATGATGGSQLAQSYAAALGWLKQLPW